MQHALSSFSKLPISWLTSLHLLLCCALLSPAVPVAELLRIKGVPNILFWSEDPSALVAAHFSSILFSVLALEGHVSLLEAYALTLFATQVKGRLLGVCDGSIPGSRQPMSALEAAATASSPLQVPQQPPFFTIGWQRDHVGVFVHAASGTMCNSLWYQQQQQLQPKPLQLLRVCSSSVIVPSCTAHYHHAALHCATGPLRSQG